MAHLIDKDALVAEINKRITDAPINNIGHQRVWAYNDVKDIINTLEVKEVDLEKELIEWHKEHFKKDGTFIGMSGFYLTNNSQMDIAKHFFVLGLKAKQG